jgi:mRNA interferase MazF
MVASPVVRRGDIFWVDFEPARGSEQGGTRPALVIQNDAGNAHAPTTIVAGISSRAFRRRYLFHVPLPAATLKKPSTVMCEQLLTVDKSYLRGEPIAHLSPELMAEVDQALRRSLGI